MRERSGVSHFEVSLGKILQTLSRRKPITEKGSGVVQGVGPEVKPQNSKNEKRKRQENLL
jgi:hypothetical protein